MASRFQLNDRAIRRSLDQLSQAHPAIRRAVDSVGYPRERRREHSFPSLVSIVVGQQLSTKAASTIGARVLDVVGGVMEPAAILEASDDALRTAGLSHQKISYVRALAEAVRSQALPIEALPTMSDEEVLARITAVRGFGPWSAHMYLMFALGRPDIWPIGDLAVRVGFGRIMGWRARPDEKKVARYGAAFAPHRSALALLCWRFYSEAPL
jgi:DNA-3-methyladenine glycosylase II